jgi:hypothetical protein
MLAPQMSASLIKIGIRLGFCWVSSLNAFLIENGISPG